MSEFTSDAPGQPEEKHPGIAWGDDISPERLAELREMFQQRQGMDGPRDWGIFKDVRLNGADVFWLAAMALAGRFGNLDEAAWRLRTPRNVLDLSALHLEGALLNNAQLSGANLRQADLSGVDLGGAHLENANLGGTRLIRTNLSEAHLEGSDLDAAQLIDAQLVRAQVQGADLSWAVLYGADLRQASFDKTTQLYDTQLDGVRFDQVIFDNANLTVIGWETVKRLGDERIVRAERGAEDRAVAYHTSARAYRSLAVALRNQGLGADATRFHYRSELMERKSSWWRIFAVLRTLRFYTAPTYFGRWLFSWILGTFAGYGDYFGRLLVTYLLTVSAFAGAMFLLSSRAVTFDAIRDAFVLSITSFHGRGVQPPGLTLTDALATLTAVEAFFGLFIEGIFIAAFTRRVTGN